MGKEDYGWIESLESLGCGSLLDAVERKARAKGTAKNALRAEKARLERCLFHEREAHARGCLYVAGVDEAGRGPLAGPVAASAVIFQGEPLIPCLDDSKCLSPKLRESLFRCVGWEALAVSFSMVSVEYIERHNILRATQEAMKRAIFNLSVVPDLVLVDGLHLPGLPFPQKALKKGDSLSASISAASIVAKVLRDRYMTSCHARFPQYNFRQNKGYGTREHWDALRAHGPCPIHRRSFLDSMKQVAFDFD